MNATDETFDTLEVTQRGRVLLGRFSDPPHNFMTSRLQHDLATLVRAVEHDESVGAVVLTGGVPGRFITHFEVADIAAAADAGPALPALCVRGLLGLVDLLDKVPGAGALVASGPLGGLKHVHDFHEVALSIQRSPAVWIAAINGTCGGGGLELALCFDHRIAAEASHFTLPELLIGLTSSVGSQRLLHQLGPSRALEMMLAGDLRDARQALGLGLVDHVVPDEDLLEQAVAVAERFAQRHRRNVQAQKRILYFDARRRAASAASWAAARNVEGIMGGPARRVMGAWLEQRSTSGESTFLTRNEAWVSGTAVDLNSTGSADTAHRAGASA